MTNSLQLAVGFSQAHLKARSKEANCIKQDSGDLSHTQFYFIFCAYLIRISRGFEVTLLGNYHSLIPILITFYISKLLYLFFLRRFMELA